MSLGNQPFYENSVAGILTRLTHGIFEDANERAQEKNTLAASDVTNAVADSSAGLSGLLDRVDTWFWRREMKSHEAFLAQSIDIFDLERRMRCLERGDMWLGTNRRMDIAT